MSASLAFLIADAEQLRAWARDPSSAARLSTLAGFACLLVDAARHRLGIEEDQPAVQRWLKALACPAIAFGTEARELSSACDVQVQTRAEAETLARQIERTPLAASLLVQVLRAVEHIPREEGLLVESLAYSSLQSGPEFLRWQSSFTPATPSCVDEGPPVRVQREQDRLTLELNRPSRLNAMSVDMRDALIEALQLVLIDDTIRQVGIRAGGRCFSTGGDLEEFGSAPDPATAHLVRRFALPGRLLDACRERASVHVHGACIGSGIEFPAFATRLIATPDAWFQLPELRYGLIPGAGGCVSISRRIGRQRTAWMALSGKRIGAQLALDWGLIDAIEAFA